MATHALSVDDLAFVIAGAVPRHVIMLPSETRVVARRVLEVLGLDAERQDVAPATAPRTDTPTIGGSLAVVDPTMPARGSEEAGACDCSERLRTRAHARYSASASRDDELISRALLLAADALDDDATPRVGGETDGGQRT